MPVPSTIADLSLTAGNNSPAGTDVPDTNTGPDDYLRAHAAIIKQLAADSGSDLAKTDGNFIVGNGTAWVAESGATARASLGLTIGTHVQAYDADLTAIAALTPTDSNFIVGNGTAWVAESGATARTSLGIGSATTSTAGLVTKSTTAENAAGTGTGVVASADLPTAVAALTTSIGVNQTWQDETGSRALTTVFQNTSSKPIQISVAIGSTGGTNYIYVGAANPPTEIASTGSSSGYAIHPHNVIVPPNFYYRATSSAGALNSWFELK